MNHRTRATDPGRAIVRSTLAFGLILLATASRSQAQYGGFGGGYGYGFNLYNQNAYTDVNYLNSRSLINAQSAAANRPQPLESPQFQTRDDSFYQKYDLASREAMISRVARDPEREMGTADPSGALPLPPRTRNPQPRASTAPAPKPVVHLAEFFDKSQRLVWPSSAPITGDLGKKQESADQAVLAVFNEYELNGLARLSSVTEARRKLVDYGTPALEYLQKQTTPALADSFHVFLLSLYGNLGLAATVPKPPK